MPASPVLADSSWYISEMRARRSPRKQLEAIASSRTLVTCGMVQCEVGRGLIRPDIRREFHALWAVMVYVPTRNALWDEVEEILWSLERRGLTIPLADVVIACCAKQVGAVVLTYDRHFSLIPGITATDRIH